MSLNSSGETEDERREYLEERRALVQAEQLSAGQFDKTIITLSSGALGLSIVFVREIAPSPIPETVTTLWYAWLAFGTSLLLILLSFLLSQQAIRRQREIIGQDYRGEVDVEKAVNCPGVITNYLNWISMIAFMTGVVLLGKFALNNLPN